MITEQAPLPEQDFRPLDPRAIRLWVATNLIGYAILLLVVLVSLLVWVFIRPKFLWWMLAGWALMVVVSLWYSFWHPPRAYRAWGYRINGKVLETKSGIIFHQIQLLPLSRLQHVDLQRGPFERMYGLSSLILHTAGTHSSSITIPGLDADEAVRLRNHLVEIGGDDAV